MYPCTVQSQAGVQRHVPDNDDVKRAAKALELATKLAPKHFAAYNQLGNVYSEPRFQSHELFFGIYIYNIHMSTCKQNVSGKSG
jgi:hypothetical protein